MYRDRSERDDRGGSRGGYGGGGGGGYSGGGGSSFGGGDRQRFAPVKEGDELDVKIEAVGEKGDGIAKKQGFVLFVPKTKAGDEVRIRVTKVLKSAGFAEVIGQATSIPAPSSAPRVHKKEEEFVPKTENDSENFGEEGEAEQVAEHSDDDTDENSEETQED